jgi:putative CocE/NonD family hydrolase
MMAAHKRAHQRLILGGWRHGINRDREINGVRFGIDVIRPDINFLMLEWYDRFLKNIHNGVDSGPTVEYFSVGDNAWHAASAWPPAEAHIQQWYLHSDGDAATTKHGGLSTVAPQHEPPDPYRYDPQDPTPDLIDVSLNEQALPNDYRSVDARPDVAVYETPVLRAPLRIAGPLEAVLFASSSGRDTDWIVRLSDVDSAGHAYRLVTGLIRARHRQSMAVETLLRPGEIARYRITLRSIAATMLPGHRLRVSVASAASGYIFPNSNTGGDEAHVTRTVVADQQVYHDAAHASYVVLPVISSD